MNTFHPNISILIHISMAIRGAEKPHNSAVQPAPCTSVPEYLVLLGHTPGTTRAPCGLPRAWGKGLMKDLWDPYLRFPGPYRNTKQLTCSCLPVGEDKGLYLRKHWNILNTNFFTLACFLWKPEVQAPREQKVFQRGFLLGSPRNGRLPILQGNPASERWQGGSRLTLHPHTASNIALTSRTGHKARHSPLQTAIPPKPAKPPS